MQRKFNKSSKFSKAREPQRAPRARKIEVKEENTLLNFLVARLDGQSKSSVKSLLSNRQISVNENITKQFDEPLKPGDIVSVSFERGKMEFNHPLLKIVWEDDYLMLVEKKSGLLSVATDREKERTAQHLLSQYVIKNNPQNRIFILHRLDKDTSGLLMFAKDRMTQNKMQDNWNDVITQRTYVAVVEGCPEKETDIITNFLQQNAGMKMYVAENGTEAVTRYQVVKSNGKYTQVELNLETGRKNQIRAHMESIGHPIAGDPKYGARTNPAGRLMLHARNLSFIHPVTNEEMRFVSSIPPVFNGIVKKVL